MFKNITYFALEPEWAAPSADALRQQLAKERFTPCLSTEDYSSGWTPPQGKGATELLEAVGQHLFLSFTIETKKVSASAVKHELEIQTRDMEAAYGRALSKREKKELKELIQTQLITKALPKQSHIPVCISPHRGWVLIGSTSKSALDEVLSALASAFALTGQPLQIKRGLVRPAQRLMTNWLLAQAAEEPFELGQELELWGQEIYRSTIRYTRHEVGLDEVVNHIREGKQVHQLGLLYRHLCAFTLCDDESLRKVVLTDDARLEAAGDDFYGTALMFGDTLCELVSALQTRYDALQNHA
jgi:recombination associated protein RdgC